MVVWGFIVATLGVCNGGSGLRALRLAVFAIVALGFGVGARGFCDCGLAALGVAAKVFGHWRLGLRVLRLGLSVTAAWGLRALPLRALGGGRSGLLEIVYCDLWALRLRDLSDGGWGTFGVATLGFARCLGCFGVETAGR